MDRGSNRDQKEELMIYTEWNFSAIIEVVQASSIWRRNRVG